MSKRAKVLISKNVQVEDEHDIKDGTNEDDSSFKVDYDADADYVEYESDIKKDGDDDKDDDLHILLTFFNLSLINTDNNDSLSFGHSSTSPSAVSVGEFHFAVYYGNKPLAFFIFDL